MLQDGPSSASFDGMPLDGGLIVEMRGPFKGRNSELWRSVQGGAAPRYYGAQVQHQRVVRGAQEAHMWVFDGSAGGEPLAKRTSEASTKALERLYRH